MWGVSREGVGKGVGELGSGGLVGKVWGSWAVWGISREGVGNGWGSSGVCGACREGVGKIG